MTVHIGVDVGGTFTDFAVSLPEKNIQLLYKLPSTPERPDEAIIEGLEYFLTNHKLDPKEIVRFGHGTTVGTNALIQRRVGKVAMVTSRGFRDLLEIGRQTRPKVYDMHQDFPKPLVPRWLRYEVSERMRADGIVHVPLDEQELKEIAFTLKAANIDCVAVCFLHSHAFPEHEERAAEILRKNMPDEVSIMTSSMVYPEFREYERFSTTVLNAALLTVMNAYLDRLTKGVAEKGVAAEPTISQSGGGLMSATYSRRYPIRSALSGPAAGVLGAAYRAKATNEANVITLDIGGTSADVSLLANGEPSVVHSRRLAGFPLRLPALDVNAVGAGGGSIAWIDRDGLLKVGPDSAGAVPGPACYGNGGLLATVTDANVVLGRLPDDSLLDGRMTIRRDLAEEAIDNLAEKLSMSREATALGVVQVASAVIVKAIRAISVERGHDPSKFSLFAFGGAGPLHAVDVAKDLGIRKVFIPPNPGILCAEGLLGSDLVADLIQPSLAPFDNNIYQSLNLAKSTLDKRARDWFETESVEVESQGQGWSADLRYKGQNFELPIAFDNDQFDQASASDLRKAFDQAHEAAYGYSQSDELVELVGMRVKLTGVLSKPPLPKIKSGPCLNSIGSRKVLFGKDIWCETPIYRRDAIPKEQGFEGPAIIEQMDSMLLIFPGDRAKIDEWGNLIIVLSQMED
ncbi:MAG: hydantoinase/oxoprolinase family protein [Rhodospirillaceae bacterium]|nr:hydantoinase/oxoprolinase family protein [Rhodospirillaceae bacterium]